MRLQLVALLLLLGAASCSESAEALADKGLTAVKAGRLDEGMALFEQAITKDPSQAKARYNLGIALLQKGRPADAAAQFRAFVEARPNDQLGHFSLARAELAAGDKEGAIRSLQKAVLEGFAEHGALSVAGFDVLADDVRYAQLEAVIAQRANVRPPLAEDFKARSGEGYGGQRLGAPIALPGTKINAPNCAAEEGASCEPPAAR